MVKCRSCALLPVGAYRPASIILSIATFKGGNKFLIALSASIILSISDADTVKTDVAGKRDGTKTSRYRKDNAVPSTQDVDHTIDLQLGGADDVLNMNGLDKSVNRSLGKQINILIKDLPVGTVIRNFTMK